MEDKHLDEILDSALRDYRYPEPLAGIEERVLSRVQAVRTRKKLPAWFVMALAASTVLLGVVLLHTPVQQPSISRTALVPQAPPIAAGASLPGRRVAVKRHRGVRHGVPKEEQFPSPSLLTGEERALISLVNSEGPAVAQMFADLQKETDQPVEVQRIQIQPLTTLERENQ